MSTELENIANGSTIDDMTFGAIQAMADKTAALPSLWKKVYHIAGREHFLATSISAEWEDGANLEYNTGDEIDFSALHVYLHEDDEYTEKDENRVTETTSWVPSITKVPSDAEIGELQITVTYGSENPLTTTVTITVTKPYPLPVDIDYYEGFGYVWNGYDLDSERDRNWYIMFSDGYERQTEYTNIDTMIPSATESGDIVASVPFYDYFDGSYKTEHIDVTFHVHYHTITEEMLYDNSYAADDHVIYVCDPDSTVDVHFNLNNDYSNRYVSYYDDGKYKTSNYGTIDFSEEGLSIGEYTRKATVTFDDGKVFYKDIQISVVPPEFKIDEPVTSWTYPNIYLNDRQIYYNASNGHFKLRSDTSTYGKEHIYIDENHEYPYTPTHHIEYITSNDEQYDFDGNSITVDKSHRYNTYNSYGIRYELADTEGNKYFVGTGYTYLITPNGSRRWLNSGLSTDLSVGDTVTISDTEYTITKVFDENTLYSSYLYVDPDEYQAWAEENGFITESE